MAEGFQEFVNLPGSPAGEEWYHGRIYLQEAERRLRETNQRAIYLVLDNPYVREYVLMYLCDGKIYQWRITRRTSDNKYVVGIANANSRGHRSVRNLIEYHSKPFGKNLPLEQGGGVTLGCAYLAVENSSTDMNFCCFCTLL